jgi:hypothetical protein
MSTKNATLYDTDFYAWANEQAALLRAGRLSEADIENIAEEIESIGRSERREIVSRLAVLLHHLLKWRYQPGFRGNSWQLTVEEQRLQVGDHLGENPSLKSQMDEIMRSAYRHGCIQAAKETGLDRKSFPQDCPFTFDEAMNPDFWPE